MSSPHTENCVCFSCRLYKLRRENEEQGKFEKREFTLGGRSKTGWPLSFNDHGLDRSSDRKIYHRDSETGVVRNVQRKVRRKAARRAEKLARRGERHA